MGHFFSGGFLLFAPAAMGSFFGGYLYEANAGSSFLITALVACLFIMYGFVREPEKAAI